MTAATPIHADKTALVLNEVAQERARQDEKWGEQNHPNLWEKTPELAEQARTYAQRVAANFKAQNDNPDEPLDWAGILTEEFYEAIGEAEDDRLRKELVQVAAVAVAWIECIDRRGNK